MPKKLWYKIAPDWFCYSCQGCQIFLDTTYQNGENIPKCHLNTKWHWNIPIGRNISQMAIEYFNLLRMFQGPPKFTQIGIFVLKIGIPSDNIVWICKRLAHSWGPFLTLPLEANFAPGAKLSPRREFCSLGVKLTPGGEIICSPPHYSKQ
jgi:hypothetical protein